MSSEAITQMLVISVQGLLTVFAVLIILWAIIAIMHKCVESSKKKVKKQNNAAATTNNEGAAAALGAQDEDELVAVFIAAIAASLNTSTYNLRIKSFRHIGQSAPTWNTVSRKEQIENQL